MMDREHMLRLLKDRYRASWFAMQISEIGRPTTRAAAGRPPALDLCLLGHLQRVINLDPEIPHGAPQFGMPK